MTNLLREVLKIWNSEQYDLSIITVDEIKNILHESLTENIKDDKKVIDNYISVLYFKLLNSKYKLNDNILSVNLNDLVINIHLNRKDLLFRGDYNINTNTINLYIDTLSDISRSDFETAFYHEMTHYLNTNKYKDKSKYKDTSRLSKEQYYKSEEEFEPIVMYLLKNLEMSFNISSIKKDIPKRELPKYIFKYVIPNIIKESKMIKNFIKNLDDKHLKKFYKMSVDYFAENLSKQDILDKHNEFFKKN